MPSGRGCPPVGNFPARTSGATSKPTKCEENRTNGSTPDELMVHTVHEQVFRRLTPGFEAGGAVLT